MQPRPKGRRRREEQAGGESWTKMTKGEGDLSFFLMTRERRSVHILKRKYVGAESRKERND